MKNHLVCFVIVSILLEGFTCQCLGSKRGFTHYRVDPSFSADVLQINPSRIFYMDRLGETSHSGKIPKSMSLLFQGLCCVVSEVINSTGRFRHRFPYKASYGFYPVISNIHRIVATSDHHKHNVYI